MGRGGKRQTYMCQRALFLSLLLFIHSSVMDTQGAPMSWLLQIVYISFIHNYQNFEATKMSSFMRWMDKEALVPSHNEISQAPKRSYQAGMQSSHKKTWRKLKCILLSERSQYDSNSTTFWKKISGCLGLEGRER